MTGILLLKLCLVPALIYAVSLIGRRWGAAVAGWISALPIVAGPILLAIALERGASFAAISAANTLLAVIACVARSLAAALAAFALAGALLQTVVIPPWLGHPVVLVLLALAPAAGDLGPRVAGLLAMFPVMGTILTGFTHRASGRAAAVALLRGMVLGYVAFASFCVVLAYGLRAWPVGRAFACAVACALAVQVSMKRFGRAALAPAKA